MKQLLLWCSNGEFLISLLSTSLIGILLKGIVVPSPHLFIYLFSHLIILVWTHGYLLHSFGYYIILSLFILLIKLFQVWPLGVL